MGQSENLQRVKTYIDRMPALPVTVTKVVEVCNQPGTSAVDLNKVISVDPVLMARVMKLINSAYYGLSGKITSLVRAIIMLGVNTVKNLALSSAVVGNLGKSGNFQTLNAQGFWRHSLGVGVTSKLLARKRGVDAKILEEYFIAGLLHDIGKIPLNNALADQYVEVMAAADRERLPLIKAEKRILNIDHQETGVMIGEAWNIGANFMETIRHHHDPEGYSGDSRDLVLSVSAANYFMNLTEVGFSGERYPRRMDDEVFSYLGVDMNWLDEIEDEVEAQIQKAEIFLKMAE